MTYNLKLDEREFGIILRTLLIFRDMLEYGNAYLVKCCLVDEEKDYKN